MSVCAQGTRSSKRRNETDVGCSGCGDAVAAGEGEGGCLDIQQLSHKSMTGLTACQDKLIKAKPSRSEELHTCAMLKSLEVVS